MNPLRMMRFRTLRKLDRYIGDLPQFHTSPFIYTMVGQYRLVSPSAIGRHTQAAVYVSFLLCLYGWMWRVLIIWKRPSRKHTKRCVCVAWCGVRVGWYLWIDMIDNWWNAQASGYGAPCWVVVNPWRTHTPLKLKFATFNSRKQAYTRYYVWKGGEFNGYSRAVLWWEVPPVRLIHAVYTQHW